jgi:hypothetical protein
MLSAVCFYPRGGARQSPLATSAATQLLSPAHCDTREAVPGNRQTRNLETAPFVHSYARASGESTGLIINNNNMKERSRKLRLTTVGDPPR